MSKVKLYIPIPQNGYHLTKDTIEIREHQGFKYMGFWKQDGYPVPLDIFWRKKDDSYVGVYYDGTKLVEVADCPPFVGTMKGKSLSSGVVHFSKDGPLAITCEKGKFKFTAP